MLLHLVLIHQRVEDFTCAFQRATRHPFHPVDVPGDVEEPNVLVVILELARLHTEWFSQGNLR